MLPIDLQGKIAFVCGSTQGIGKAVAIELADLGANIVLLARNAEALAQARQELNTERGQTHYTIVADFQQPTQVQEAVAQFCQTQNLKEAHILINNTGGPAGGAITQASSEAFLQALQQHLICNQLLAQTLLPLMRQARYGRIINIISTSVKEPLENLGVSNTTRGAVASWAKTWANEVGQFGITVNNVLPGYTETARLATIVNHKATQTQQSADEVSTQLMQHVPAKRFAQPEEVAYAVAFLACPSASYINGINLPVDGGRTKSL
jgi:3-oxoacyl-[acyl-carrier protein] reductase